MPDSTIPSALPPDPLEAPFAREALAFRRGLGDPANTLTGTALPPPPTASQLRSRKSTQRPWLRPLVAAAAAVALVGGFGVWRSINHQPAQPSIGIAAIPAGWKQMSQYNVAITVPESWRWGPTVRPNSPCELAAPTNSGDNTPYVEAAWTTGMIANSATCPSSPIETTRVAFTRGPDAAPTTDPNRLVISRTVADTTISVILPPTAEATARDQAHRIVDSAVQINYDAQGCPTSRPDAVATGVISAVDKITSARICQYDATQTSLLLGSRTVDAATAQALWTATITAPHTAIAEHSCPAHAQTSTATLTYLTSSGITASELVRYDNCGTASARLSTGAHRLTHANCQPIFAELPIILPANHADQATVCE